LFEGGDFVPTTVYPDAATSTLLGSPADTPIELLAGSPTVVFAPLANHVGPDPAHFNLQTSFIRISMSGPIQPMPPQVELKAVHPSATEGSAVIITATDITTAQALLDGTNDTDAASAYFELPHANNVFLLKVVINIAGTTIKVRLTNTTGTPREFVWVVGDTDANSQRPWIHLSPDAIEFAALVGETSDKTAQSLGIINRGTGPLTITGVSPAVSTPFTVAALASNVLPNAAVPANLTLGFDAPLVIGPTAIATFELQGDSGAVAGAGHNKQFTLSATTGKVEVALALDDSGSMSWAPDGTDPPPSGTASRWSELQSAVKLFLEILAAFAASKGTFGIVKFPGRPDRPITDVESYDFLPATANPIPADVTTVKNAINLATPFYKGTPMYYALERLLTAAAPYYATDATSLDHNRRWLLLMSDGAWNSSPDPRGKIPGLNAAKIKVYGAGYGTAMEVDYPTLEAIATGPGSTAGGEVVQVDAGAGYTAAALAGAFKTAIKAGLSSLSSPADPTNTLTPGDAEARHHIVITPYDTRAMFLVNWNTPDGQRLNLQLLTPTCEVLTPEGVAANKVPGVRFSGDSRYQTYVIDEGYLQNASDPSRDRFGVWEMIVTSPIVDDSTNEFDEEQYAYDALVESTLQLEVLLDKDRYFAGDSIGITARLTLKGVPITDAAVKVAITSPGQAMANWLAAVRISRAEYQQASAALADKDASPIFVKAYAARQKGHEFKNPLGSSTISMLDHENRGLYSGVFDQTSTPDAYTLSVTAVGTTADGVFFRRERTRRVVIGVRPDPSFSVVDLAYEPIGEGATHLIGTLRVVPRDRFGNVVLLDPASSSDMSMTIEGAEVVEGLATLYDGVYSARIAHPADVRPSIDLDVVGEHLAEGLAVPVIGELQFVDDVVAFKPGGAAQSGANQHADPRDALGDLLTKDADTYTSLGAYGSLTVRFRDKAMLPDGDSDVTIFVVSGSDLRPYVVDALPIIGPDKWIELGRSLGGTQSWSLRSAGLDAALAIRITDLSGRTRGDALGPLSAPGVSVRAVGCAKVGLAPTEATGCLTWPLAILRWIRNLLKR
jgi:hypothetical protein